MNIRGLVLFIAGLAMGLAVPVAAQTLPAQPTENQLVIRSDGFLYLIRDGVRHLVSPVALTDEEVNAFAEGEPYVSGLVPVEAMAAAPVANASAPQSNSASTPTNTPKATSTSTPTGSSSSTGDVSASFSSVPSSVGRGSKLKVTVDGPDGGTCEGRVEYNGGKEDKFDKKDIKSGECKLELTVPSDAKTGNATVTVKVKKDDKSTEIRETVEIRSSGGSDGDLPLGIDAPSEIKQGEKLKVTVSTDNDAKCKGSFEDKDGHETSFSDKKAKDGECKLELTIPDNAKTGKGQIHITVSKDGDESDDDVDIDVKKK